MEHHQLHVYLNLIVPDRFALINGLQLLKDELQWSGQLNVQSPWSRLTACAADFKNPSVVTTLVHTNCGDRICAEANILYNRVIASRFASISELGEAKMEHFTPTGGGTDSGPTLAHVTVGHQIDQQLRKLVYEGNSCSFTLLNFDLMTHVGRLSKVPQAVASGKGAEWGRVQESVWREPRNACGAIVGMLTGYNPHNPVHLRLRSDLGEANFEFLKENAIIANDGTDVTYVVAAAIIAIQGMLFTADACAIEMDDRGLAHLTASVLVNRAQREDELIYLARCTVFNGDIRFQGLGTDALKYQARITHHHGEDRLILGYDGKWLTDYKIEATSYTPAAPKKHPASRFFSSITQTSPLMRVSSGAHLAAWAHSHDPLQDDASPQLDEIDSAEDVAQET
eukprot:TRINITY_DN4698_c0_g1_i1.p1 TRINITY_DN4698_c0_g1~~TRINITY_DN4698_c0_g1_i1.p1  ORF type:complete len:464 (-),score=91.52 TRINITY_DN4698_c0_g1_i1:28-1218(-)